MIQFRTINCTVHGCLQFIDSPLVLFKEQGSMLVNCPIVRIVGLESDHLSKFLVHIFTGLSMTLAVCSDRTTHLNVTFTFGWRYRSRQSLGRLDPRVEPA